MWMPEVSIVEKVVRAAVGFTFLLITFRITGKRQVGQLAPFDLVVLLIVSNVLQNAMIGPDDSIIGGLVGATTLFVVNELLSVLTFKSPHLEQLIEGKPRTLVSDGVVDEAALYAERVTRSELEAVLRLAGVTEITRVRFAVLETSGHVSVGTR